MPNHSRNALLILTVSVVAVFSFLFFSERGLGLNLTNSMPRGIYATESFRSVIIRRGDLLAVCVPNKPGAKLYQARRYLGHSTRCPVGMPPEIKPVGAVPGDLVEVVASGVKINGALIQNSRSFDLDSNGRPIDHLPSGWNHRLTQGEYFMLATYLPRSLDSRYYGVVAVSDILLTVRPVVTAKLWGSL